MTPISRVLVVATAATLLAASLGCGLISQAKGIVDNVATLGDFADRLGKAQNLTYTAEYDVDGKKDTAHLTLAQQPPNTVFIGDKGRYLFTGDAMYLCDAKDGGTTCTKSPNAAGQVGANGSALAGVAGGTFVSPELALGLILAASVVPGAKVEKSEKKVAGQDTLCAKVSGLEAAATAGDNDAVHDFSVCITNDGVLAEFAGTLQSGETAKVAMTKYKASADAKLFKLPEGAKIVDTMGGASPDA